MSRSHHLQQPQERNMSNRSIRHLEDKSHQNEHYFKLKSSQDCAHTITTKRVQEMHKFLHSNKKEAKPYSSNHYNYLHLPERKRKFPSENKIVDTLSPTFNQNLQEKCSNKEKCNGKFLNLESKSCSMTSQPVFKRRRLDDVFQSDLSLPEKNNDIITEPDIKKATGENKLTKIETCKATLISEIVSYKNTNVCKSKLLSEKECAQIKETTGTHHINTDYSDVRCTTRVPTKGELKSYSSLVELSKSSSQYDNTFQNYFKHSKKTIISKLKETSDCKPNDFCVHSVASRNTFFNPFYVTNGNHIETSEICENLVKQGSNTRVVEAHSMPLISPLEVSNQSIQKSYLSRFCSESRSDKATKSVDESSLAQNKINSLKSSIRSKQTVQNVKKIQMENFQDSDKIKRSFHKNDWNNYFVDTLNKHSEITLDNDLQDSMKTREKIKLGLSTAHLDKTNHNNKLTNDFRWVVEEPISKFTRTSKNCTYSNKKETNSCSTQKIENKTVSSKQFRTVKPKFQIYSQIKSNFDYSQGNHQSFGKESIIPSPTENMSEAKQNPRPTTVSSPFIKSKFFLSPSVSLIPINKAKRSSNKNQINVSISIFPLKTNKPKSQDFKVPANLSMKQIMEKRRHTLGKMTVTIIAPITCFICDRTFSTERLLKKHMDFHIKFPYRCDICFNCYPKQEDLSWHKHKHHKVLAGAKVAIPVFYLEKPGVRDHLRSLGDGRHINWSKFSCKNN